MMDSPRTFPRLPGLHMACAVLLGCAALLGCAVLPGCGAPADVDVDVLLARLDSSDMGLVEQAVRDLGRRAARDPARVVPPLVARLERIHRASSTIVVRVAPDLSGVTGEGPRNETVVAVLRQVRQRLVAAGWPLQRVVQLGEVIDVHVLPPADASLLERWRTDLVAELSDRGVYEVRVEVAPPPPAGAARVATAWPGDAASWDAWSRDERALLARARQQGVPYQPSREDVEMLAVASTPEAEGLEAVPVLRTSGEGAVLSEADLRAGWRDDPVTGSPSLYLTAAEQREEAVQHALAGAAGQRVWVVEDGRALASARLPGRPGTSIAFPLRAPTMDGARQRAARLAARMSVGRWLVPCRAQLVPPTTSIEVEEPVCKALVRCGPAAEAALEELAARVPELAGLVTRLREGILQTRTE